MKSKGQRTRDIRKLTGLTQQEFANRLEVSVSIVAKVENNTSPPDNLMHKISRATGIPLETLISGKLPSSIEMRAKSSEGGQSELNRLKAEVAEWKLKYAEVMITINKLIERLPKDKQ